MSCSRFPFSILRTEKVCLPWLVLLLTAGSGLPSNLAGETMAAQTEVSPEPEDLSGLRQYTFQSIDGTDRDIDVMSPAGHLSTHKKPAFIFFHGGGWDGGNMNQGNRFLEYLAGRGMVALTVDYALTPRSVFTPPESRKRDAVMDGKSSIRWVKENAKRFGIDPDRLVAGGISAGGHISVLQMMDTQINNPNDNLSISTEVQGFILMTPAFTLLESDSTPELNVFKHLEKEFPPALFIVGELDSTWIPASDELARQLVMRDQPVEYWMGLEKGHVFMVRDADSETPNLLRIDAFLRGLGFLDGPPALTPDPGDIELKLVYWNAPQSAFLDSPTIRPNPSQDYDLLFNRKTGLPPLVYTVQATDSLHAMDWIEISPAEQLENLSDGMERVRLLNLHQAALDTGLEPNKNCFYRVLVYPDPAEPQD